jgi:hypothetical protein
MVCFRNVVIEYFVLSKHLKNRDTYKDVRKHFVFQWVN